MVFFTTGHEKVKIIRHILSVSFTCKQNLSEEKLNPEKLIWFYLLEKTFLFTIICVPNFTDSNYQKVFTDIWLIFFFFFILYWFASFLTFVPLPSKSVRCAPGKYFAKMFFITSLKYLLSSIILWINFSTASSAKYVLKGLQNLSSTHSDL